MDFLAVLPQNAGGGLITLTNNVMGFGLRNVVCLNGLTGKQAGALDRLLDDGLSNAGNVRALISATSTLVVAAAGAPINYVEGTPNFVVCRTL